MEDKRLVLIYWVLAAATLAVGVYRIFLLQIRASWMRGFEMGRVTGYIEKENEEREVNEKGK